MATRPIIVTCALTGGADTAGKNPAVPVTPEEIAASAIAAGDAGAARPADQPHHPAESRT